MEKSYLTAREVEAQKPDPERRLEIAAGGQPGLYLVVQTSGAKSWALRYRHRGRTRKLTLGPYPVLSLAQARKRAREALVEVTTGADPAKAKREQRRPETFAAAFEEYLERHLKPNTRTWTETQRIAEKECLPRFGNAPIDEICTADIVRMLDAIVDRGAPVAANRTLSLLKRLYNWRKKRRLSTVNPVAGMGNPAKEHSRSRTLSLPEISEVWNAAGTMGYPLAPFFQLLILTAQRRGEVAAMRWAEVDLKAALWTLPPEANKAGRIHDVPLSTLAVETLERLPRFDGPHVLSTTGGERPISGFSKAKRRLDALILDNRRRDAKAQGLDPARVEKMERWTVHDIRRSVSTELAGMGVPPHVLAAILNHSPGQIQGVTAIYNRHQYAKERREALENWADRLVAAAQPVRQREVV